MEVVNVLLVDDHKIFREGVASLLERHDKVKLVGEASDGEEAVAKARQLRPDVILMDLHMPGSDGVEATRRIKAEMPEVEIVVLTVSERDEDLFAAIQAGARGYLLKAAGLQEVISSLIAAASRQAMISPSMTSKLVAEFTSMSRWRSRGEPSRLEISDLTPREREILKLLAHGASNREIGDILVISENTVRVHVHAILEKLQLKNRVQAARYAAQLELE